MPKLSDATPDHPLRVLIALAVLLTVFRIVTLAHSEAGLYFDEAQYWSWGQDLALGYYSKPPAIGWLLAGMSAVCGDTIFCIRLASPILHALAATLVFAVATELYDRRVGFWAALAYLTLPAVSFSALIISTDVVLSVFWCLGLYAVARQIREPGWRWMALLGIAIGGGFLSKYAMLYFLIGCGLLILAVPDARRALIRPSLGLTLGLACLILLPNLYWNATNSFATVTHLGENANWTDEFGGLSTVLEFLGAQFGIFGPILFAVYGVVLWRGVAGGLDQPTRLLLCFSLPALTLITVQAFISDANANWAAMAVPAATVLSVATLIQRPGDRYLDASFALHIVAFVVLSAAHLVAPKVWLPDGRNPFWATLGWERVADAIRQEARSGEYVAILTDQRALSAEMAYHLRDLGLPMFAAPYAGDTPGDHFQLTHPYRGDPDGPILLATGIHQAYSAIGHFETITALGSVDVIPASRVPKTLYLFRLEGYIPGSYPGG